MKRIFILMSMCLAITSLLHGQEPVSSEKQVTDSVPEEKHSSNPFNKAFIKQQTDVIVSSVFGDSKTLNNADSIINKFDALPSFGIYKDNYLVVGTDLFKNPSKQNSDAKFQVSIRQRLTNSVLPFKTYFFLTYTQKAFWDVFEDSFPFRDLNFNPSLGLGKAIVYNNRLLGNINVQFEHESNGKDSISSRSWNKISFGSSLTLNDNWTLHSKIWIPIVDGENNPDIVHYAGWGHLGMEYTSAKRKYSASCLVTKRGGTNLNANVVMNFAIRLFSDDNQYLFVEYYNGYGECLLNYNEYRQRIRFGIVIKPDFLSSF